jgi:putative transposase
LHVLNRAAARIRLFSSDKDFLAFEALLIEAHQRFPIPILSYCIMKNHWHVVVQPDKEGQATAFFRWLTLTHAMRCRTAKRTVGYGPLYQGRFKSFLIEEDEHLLAVCRYVERNALTAGLVSRAQDWRWGSLFVREKGSEEMRKILADWPVDRPGNWVERVNKPLTAKEIEAISPSLVRGRPFGSSAWLARTAKRFDLTHTIRPEGRPPKAKKGAKWLSKLDTIPFPSAEMRM